MKKSDAKKWVEALRSGEYKQTRMVLCEGDEMEGTTAYCCLGVACDLFVDSYWIRRPADEEWSIGGRSTILPTEEMMKSMGLNIEYVKDLVDLNDKGWSFAKIADKIERDLL